jgi:hypothetical protein
VSLNFVDCGPEPCAKENLILNGNRLQGSIPQNIGNCTQLEAIMIQGNQFTGTVPSTIGRLTSLGTSPRRRVVNCKAFFCPINCSLSKMSTEVFNLHDNKIGGAMPQEVCDLRNETLGNVLQEMTATCSETQSYKGLEDDDDSVECALPGCCDCKMYAT